MKILIAVALVFLVNSIGRAEDSIQFYLACDPKTKCKVIPIGDGKKFYLEQKARFNLTSSDVVSVHAVSYAPGDWETFSLKLTDEAAARYSSMVNDNAGVNMGVMYGQTLMAYGAIPEGGFKGLLEVQVPSTGPQSLRHADWLVENLESTHRSDVKAVKCKVIAYATITLLLLLSALYWIYRRKDQA